MATRRARKTTACRQTAAKEDSTRKGVYIGLQSRGVFALPADMRKRHHHLDEPGAQVLVIEREDGVIELRPQAAIPVDQKWFWTQSWQTSEGEANADIAAGRVTEHESGEAFLEHLDSLREQS